VHPGAASVDRRWPADRFAAVAAGLADRGHAVRVTAGPGEEALARTVVRQTGRPAVTVAAGLDLPSLADLVGDSALVVCGDTGVAHLATALCTPSVVIFGPAPPSRWGPPPLPRHRVLWRPPSVLSVPTSEVLATALDTLGAR
jgi:ADP-heptose:LPS heptosyltransferase